MGDEEDGEWKERAGETAPRDDGRQPRQLHAVSQGPNADYLIPLLLRLIPLLIHLKKNLLRHTKSYSQRS